MPTDLLAVLALAALAAPPAGPSPANPEADAPAIACTLDPAAKRERRALLEREIVPAIAGVEELDTGYVLWFDRAEGRLASLGRFVELESECCAFLDFAIRLASGGERIALELTGPAGTKEMLQPLIESASGGSRR
jgi:hypothetical protein